MTLVLMAKAFKLNYSTPTNNNQRISSSPHNRQIAQPGMNMGQDKEMQMVGGNSSNQFRQYVGQNVGNQNGINAVQNVENQVVQNAVQNLGVQNVRNQNGLNVVPRITNQNQNRNGNVVAARVEGNATRNNANQIRCCNCRGLGHFARNCTQASTLGTQTDKAPVYDSDGSAKVHNYDNCYDNEIFSMFTQEEQYTKLLDPILEPHQVLQNDSNVIFEVSSVEQDGRTIDLHAATVEKTRAYFESLYNNLSIKVEKVTEQMDTTKGMSVNTQFRKQSILGKPPFSYGTNLYFVTPLPKSKVFPKVFKQKDTTKGTSVNTQSCKKSILGKPPSSSKLKLYAVTPFPKSKGFSKINETHDLSKPVTSNSIPTSQEPKVVKNDKVIAPEMFRINPFKPFREEKNQILKEYFDSVGISHQASSVRTPQQNGVVERRNRTFVEAARTMFIFSRAPLFLWAKAIATGCYTQNRSIIHRRFNKTPYELINGRKPNISFLHVFGALCYPKNDHEDIGKLGAKGDIGFFISYFADFCAYRVYNQRTNKIIETMNVIFNELSAMAFEQSSSKPELQSMTSGQISSGLDLNYAPSTITTQQSTKGELDLLFEAMYDDYIGGQPSAAPITVLAAQAP
nr:hypothetical protein [Tanacetum cinerariifolium]